MTELIREFVVREHKIHSRVKETECHQCHKLFFPTIHRKLQRYCSRKCAVIPKRKRAYSREREFRAVIRFIKALELLSGEKYIDL